MRPAAAELESQCARNRRPAPTRSLWSASVRVAGRPREARVRRSLHRPRRDPHVLRVQPEAAAPSLALRLSRTRTRRKSPVPVPPIPGLAGKRGGNFQFPTRPGTGIGKSPVSRFGRRETGIGVPGPGHPGAAAGGPGGPAGISSVVWAQCPGPQAHRARRPSGCPTAPTAVLPRAPRAQPEGAPVARGRRAAPPARVRPLAAGAAHWPRPPGQAGPGQDASRSGQVRSGLLLGQSLGPSESQGSLCCPFRAPSLEI